jgi:peroxiredoxin
MKRNSWALRPSTSTKQRVTTGDTGVYVAYVEFDEVGDWGVEIKGSADGETIGPIALPFEVLSPDHVLNIGDPAPRSRQTIASDVAEIRDIDSMLPPDQFHGMTVADAAASGKPSVVFFGTPAFCETRTCAPVMETMMLPLSEQYKDRVNFIHVEPFRLEELRNGITSCAVPAFNSEFARRGIGEGGRQCPMASEAEVQAVGESWNLNSEPIAFVVDRQGKIAGIFDGIIAPQEVEEVLRLVTG